MMHDRVTTGLRPSFSFIGESRLMYAIDNNNEVDRARAQNVEFISKYLDRMEQTGQLKGPELQKWKKEMTDRLGHIAAPAKVREKPLNLAKSLYGPPVRVPPEEGQKRRRYDGVGHTFIKEIFEEGAWVAKGTESLAAFNARIDREEERESEEKKNTGGRPGVRRETAEIARRAPPWDENGNRTPGNRTVESSRHYLYSPYTMGPALERKDELDRGGYKPIGKSGTTESYDRFVHNANLTRGSASGPTWVDTAGGGYFDSTQQHLGPRQNGRRTNDQFVSFSPRSTPAGFTEGPLTYTPRTFSAGLTPAERDASKLSDLLAKDWPTLSPQDRQFRTSQLRSYIAAADRVADEARVDEPRLPALYKKFIEVGPRIGMDDADRAIRLQIKADSIYGRGSPDDEAREITFFPREMRFRTSQEAYWAKKAGIRFEPESFAGKMQGVNISFEHGGDFVVNGDPVYVDPAIGYVRPGFRPQRDASGNIRLVSVHAGAGPQGGPSLSMTGSQVRLSPDALIDYRSIRSLELDQQYQQYKVAELDFDQLFGKNGRPGRIKLRPTDHTNTATRQETIDVRSLPPGSIRRGQYGILIRAGESRFDAKGFQIPPKIEVYLFPNGRWTPHEFEAIAVEDRGLAKSFGPLMTPIPLTPDIPEIPTIPTVPTVPEIPVVPMTPVLPTVPQVPTTPTIPIVPQIPVVPVYPSYPVQPQTPQLPVQPVSPTLPNTPTPSTVSTLPNQPTVPLQPAQPVGPVQPPVPGLATNPSTPRKPEQSDAVRSSLLTAASFFALSHPNLAQIIRYYLGSPDRKAAKQEATQIPDLPSASPSSTVHLPTLSKNVRYALVVASTYLQFFAPNAAQMMRSYALLPGKPVEQKPTPTETAHQTTASSAPQVASTPSVSVKPPPAKVEQDPEHATVRNPASDKEAAPTASPEKKKTVTAVLAAIPEGQNLLDASPMTIDIEGSQHSVGIATDGFVVDGNIYTLRGDSGYSLIGMVDCKILKASKESGALAMVAGAGGQEKPMALSAKQMEGVLVTLLKEGSYSGVTSEGTKFEIFRA